MAVPLHMRTGRGRQAACCPGHSSAYVDRFSAPVGAPLQAMAKAAVAAYDFDGEDDDFAASPVPKPKAKVGCP